MSNNWIHPKLVFCQKLGECWGKAIGKREAEVIRNEI